VVAQRYPFQRPTRTSRRALARWLRGPSRDGLRCADACPRPVWAISGDGAASDEHGEIATMVQEGIEVKPPSSQRSSHGPAVAAVLPRRRYSNTPILSPDYVKLAEAYGIRGGASLRASDHALRRDVGLPLVELVLSRQEATFGDDRPEDRVHVYGGPGMKRPRTVTVLDEQRAPHARPRVRALRRRNLPIRGFAVDSHGPPRCLRLSCEIDADDATLEELALANQECGRCREATST